LLVVELELVEVLEELRDLVVEVDGTEVELLHLVVDVEGTEVELPHLVVELDVDGEVVEVVVVPHLAVVDVLVVDELDESEEVEYNEVVEAEVVTAAVVVVLLVVVPLPQFSAYGRAIEVPARAATINESDLCILGVSSLTRGVLLEIKDVSKNMVQGRYQAKRV